MARPDRSFRLTQALLALAASEDASQRVLITLLPGCMLKLVGDPQPTGLVEVVIEEKRYTVFYPDVQQRSLPLARASFRAS